MLLHRLEENLRYAHIWKIENQYVQICKQVCMCEQENIYLNEVVVLIAHPQSSYALLYSIVCLFVARTYTKHIVYIQKYR